MDLMSQMPESITHRAPQDGVLSEAVIAAVAAFKNKEPLELPPLFETLDPDALDSLFGQPSDAVRRLTFEYAGCEITIEEDGRITVAERY